MSNESFPKEIAEQVKQFHLNVISLKKELEPIIKDIYQIKDDIEKTKDPIKSATLELTLCQAINSLFYMYLQTNGVDASSHSIGHELYRIEKYTNRLKQIKDNRLKPKLNKNAASAFVRNALFDSNEMESKVNPQTNEIILSDSDDDPTKEKPAKRIRTN